MLLAIFILACGLLLLELFATSVLGIVIGSHAAYYSIATAMLGLGAASTLVSLLPQNRLERWRHWFVAYAAHAIGPAVVAFLVLATQWKAHINADRLAALAQGESNAWVLMEQQEYSSSLLIGGGLCLVYFLHGLVLSSLFRLNTRRIAPLYAFDLFGAAFGCMAFVWVLEHLGYASTATLAIALPMAASAVFAHQMARPRTALTLAISAVAFAGITQVPPLAKSLEPQPLLELMSHDHRLTRETEELDHQWTSFGRITALRHRPKGSTEPYREVMVQREGNSTAIIPNPDRIESAAIDGLLRVGNHEKILVLFAGAGRDLLELNRHFPEADITGVELVPQMFAWPNEHFPERMAAIHDNPKLRLVEAEGREFISRSKDLYDLIFLSYSGAGANHYTGATAHSAGYLYTSEAFGAMLSHLAPGGRLILVNGNKGRFIRTLKELWPGNARPTVPLEDGLLVVSKDSYERAIMKTVIPWDPAILLIAPDGVGSDADIATLTEGYTVLYRPRAPHKMPYGLFLNDSATKQFEQSKGLSFAPVWDDFPYFLNLAPRDINAILPWNKAPEPSPPAVRRLRNQIKLLGMFLLAAIITTILPVLLAGRSRGLGASSWNHMVYFLGLGLGFMLIEIGLLNKLQLVVGHPGYTLAVVLTSVILFAGAGSYCSDRLFDRRWLDFRRAAFAVVISGALMLAFFNHFSHELTALPRAIKILLAIAVPAIPFFMMGQLFPQGMRAAADENKRFVAWAFALNGVASAAGSGLAILLSRVYGYTLVIIAGLLVYLVIALLPHTRRLRALAAERAATATT